MKEILVDSSVWIDYFAGKDEARVIDNLIDKNLICINDLILCELVPFLKQKKQKQIIDLLYSVKNIPLQISWDRIVNYQYINLKNGINRVGIPDLIILQNVIDNKLELLSFDKHFELIKTVIDFNIYKL